MANRLPHSSTTLNENLLRSRGPPLKKSASSLMAIATFAALTFGLLLHAQAPSGTPAAPASADQNRKALNGIFQEYWEDSMKHAPEFASILGDKRYNDQISDRSEERRV